MVKMLWTVVAQRGIDYISSALNPIATALRGRSLYEIERMLRIVTIDSMNIGVAL